MVFGSHAKTRAMDSIPPCPRLAASTAAYRRRSFSDSQPKNRCIFRSTSAEYPSMPHSLIRVLLRSKDTAAQAIREVILDHILSDLRERFHRFYLELHPEKTRLIEFGRWASERRQRRGQGKPETFDFLGLTHMCSTTKRGKFTVRRCTIATRLRKTLQEVKQTLRERM